MVNNALSVVLQVCWRYVKSDASAFHLLVNVDERLANGLSKNNLVSIWIKGHHLT
jgi:hypothetical protein